MEQTPQHSAHEQDRNKHRHQRNADGDHGKPNVARALQHRLTQRHAALAQAGDVLQHHDGVVHHKTSGNRQGHQAEIVQTELHQVHDGESACQ